MEHPGSTLVFVSTITFWGHSGLSSVPCCLQGCHGASVSPGSSSAVRPSSPAVPSVSPHPHQPDGQLPGGKPQLRQGQNSWQSLHFNPYHKGVVLAPLLAHCCGWACIYLPVFLCFLSLCLFQGPLYFDSSPTPVVC